jgi:tetratricopeptide (TPR) repeat protein
VGVKSRHPAENELEAHFPYVCGNVSAALDRERSAIAYFRSEIRRTSYYKAHYDLAILLSKRGRLKEAIFHYRQAARRSRRRADRSDVLNNLALTYARRGLEEEAIKTLRDAIRQNPRSVAPRVNLALQLLSRGDRDQGRRWLEGAFRLRHLETEANAERWVGYALVEYDLDIRRGVRMLQQRLARNPRDWAAMAVLAVGYMKLGEHRQAKTLAKRAKRRAPDDREVSRQAGIASRSVAWSVQTRPLICV